MLLHIGHWSDLQARAFLKTLSSRCNKLSYLTITIGLQLLIFFIMKIHTVQNPNKFSSVSKSSKIKALETNSFNQQLNITVAIASYMKRKFPVE